MLKHNGDSYDLKPEDPELSALKQMSPIYGLLAGKIRRKTRLMPGDRVKIELSEYKSSAGKIVARIIERIKAEEELLAPPPIKKHRK